MWRAAVQGKIASGRSRLQRREETKIRWACERHTASKMCHKMSRADSAQWASWGETPGNVGAVSGWARNCARHVKELATCAECSCKITKLCRVSLNVQWSQRLHARIYIFPPPSPQSAPESFALSAATAAAAHTSYFPPTPSACLSHQCTFISGLREPVNKYGLRAL